MNHRFVLAQICGWCRSRDDRGASLVEYGLLVALITIACIASLGALTATISDNFESVSSTVDSSTAAN